MSFWFEPNRFWLSFVNVFLCSPPWWPPGSTALLPWRLAGWWQLHFLAVRNSKGHYLKCVASASLPPGPVRSPCHPHVRCSWPTPGTHQPPSLCWPLLWEPIRGQCCWPTGATCSPPWRERWVLAVLHVWCSLRKKLLAGSRDFAARAEQHTESKTHNFKKSYFMFRWCRHFVFHFADPKYLFLTGCFLHTIHSGN